jgi:DUF4097 and DUF4098 domain-containing protein YvlB
MAICPRFASRVDRSATMGAVVTFAVLFANLALAPPAQAQDETERVTRTLKLEPGGTLRLKNFSGRVTITGTADSQVEIDAVRTAPRERLSRVKLDIRAEGSMVVVEANRHGNSWFEGHRNNVVRTDFTIKVPARTNLEIDVFSSSVDIRGVEGTHRVHGFSSTLRLDDVTGPVQAHTFSGEVTIREKSWQPNQTIEVDTFSGRVEVHVPDAAGGSVSFHSFSGRLTSGVPLTLRTSGRKTVEATLGDDPNAGTLRFKTFSGDVRIDR